MSYILEINNDLYLAYAFLKKFDISYNTITKWASRNGDPTYTQNGQAYFCYDAIPYPSLAKLPTIEELRKMLKGEEIDELAATSYKKLHYAQISNWQEYCKYYKAQYSLNHKKALFYGMKRAVWECLLQLHNNKKGTLEALYTAYSKLYADQYGSKIRFSLAIKQARTEGLETFILDKRAFSERKLEQYDDFVKYITVGVIEFGKAYSAPKIREKIKPVLAEKGYKCPSLTWIKDLKRAYSENTNVQNSRYGRLEAQKTQPYASIIAALNPGTQWQIDGWELPFWGDKFQRYTLFAIRDAHSKKVVGYSIDKSENTISILKGLEDAVINTGGLPYEIVSDNHSFNKTKEAEHFKAQLAEYKITWTVSENPRHKSIAERYFRDFGDRFCKDHHGYIGQGIKTKLKDGRTKPELIDKYAKKFISEEEIKLIAISAISEFNGTTLPKAGKTPNELYDRTDKPHFTEIEPSERLKVLIKKAEYKVQRGQINIIRGGVTHEFQLKPDQFRKYNSKQVAVRYDTLDLIYIFDLKTDNFIAAVKPKMKIHGALADQTQTDVDKYYRNKSHIKSIKAKDRNDLMDLTASAHQIEPDAYLFLNRLSTPKDILKDFEQNHQLKQRAYDMGIDLAMVQTVERTSELSDEAMMPVEKRKERSPFTPKNHQISIIEPNNEI